MRPLSQSCPDDLAERVAIGTKRPLPEATRPSKERGTKAEIDPIFQAQVYALTSVKAERRDKCAPKECNRVANRTIEMCATRRIYSEIPIPSWEWFLETCVVPLRGPYAECSSSCGTLAARFGAGEPLLGRARRKALWPAVTPTVSGVGQGGRDSSACPRDGSRSNAWGGPHG